MNTFIEFIFVLVLIIGIYFIEKNSFSIITFVSLSIIFSRISEPLANFLAIVGFFDIVEKGFKNTQKLLSTKELRIKKPNQKPKTFDIEFQNVSFIYDKSKNNILNNISFKVEKNSFCAIVGESGSGKTTITKLLMGYDFLKEGKIKIGGIDLAYIKQKDLMSCISVVFQDVYLFNDSIYNNIKMGKSNANKNEIIEASKKASCHDFILKLPNGYETKVGDLGSSLSGGEKQRISIARAILKDAPIIILDELSSSLDKENELIVIKAIKELIKFKTVIFISHNISTIIDANNILVLNEGQIIESGTHVNLMKNKKIYYELYKIQNK